jgi:1,2-diacylglycerol 3-beta-galactosyltransferase
LGWKEGQFTVLLLGGAEGMAPLRAIAMMLCAGTMPLQLAVVCGRNERLKTQLAGMHWPFLAHIYGFVENMSELMAAADVVVTKAGPSTIMEALNCGRPLLLSGAIPGQEEGNVSMVVEGGAGWWTPSPELVIERLRALREDRWHEIDNAAVAARKLASPDAARLVAAEIIALLAERVTA